jgi:hypothetical protein
MYVYLPSLPPPLYLSLTHTHTHHNLIHMHCNHALLSSGSDDSDTQAQLPCTLCFSLSVPVVHTLAHSFLTRRSTNASGI